MSRTRITLATAILLAAAACSNEQPTTAITDPAPGPDIGLAAFSLTIDVATGRITVAPPARSAQGSAASFSLVGSEAVTLHATNCTWSNISGNTKQKRCTFDLSVENRLGGVDLVTPTTFPKPPVGATGLLVFPFTSASLGTPSNAAVPSPDWDNPPANFFNDFGGCPGGKTSDCYRSETFVSPLYATETSGARTVGFDVDRYAQTVAAYIVVAADIRDATPPLTLTIRGDSPRCGTVRKYLTPANSFDVLPGDTLAAGGDPISGNGYRGACTFTLPPGIVHVTRATLRFYQDGVSSYDPFASGNVFIADHLDYGAQLTSAMYDQAPLAANIGTISTDPSFEYKSLIVTSSVRDDVSNGRPTSQFRLRSLQEPGPGIVTFNYTGVGPSQLVLIYRTN